MFKRLSHQGRFYVLLLVIFLLGLLTYQLAIKVTLRIKQESEQILEQINRADNTQIELGALKKRLDTLGKIIGSSQDEEFNSQEKLMESTSRFCTTYELGMKEIASSHYFRVYNYNLETNRITVIGNFTQMVKMLDELEKHNVLGMVKSCDFFITTDPRTKVKTLNATIYVQSIKKSA